MLPALCGLIFLFYIFSPPTPLAPPSVYLITLPFTSRRKRKQPEEIIPFSHCFYPPTSTCTHLFPTLSAVSPMNCPWSSPKPTLPAWARSHYSSSTQGQGSNNSPLSFLQLKTKQRLFLTPLPCRQLLFFSPSFYTLLSRVVYNMKYLIPLLIFLCDLPFTDTYPWKLPVEYWWPLLKASCRSPSFFPSLATTDRADLFSYIHFLHLLSGPHILRFPPTLLCLLCRLLLLLLTS